MPATRLKPSASKPLVTGNWKMNGLRASTAELGKIAAGYDAALRNAVDLLVCPPATLTTAFAVTAIGSRIAIGAQDCHAKTSGAYTGNISAAMLADAGATYVILGHSERRQYHRESDQEVADKTAAAWREGLTAIVCVGETEAERDAGKALAVVRRQIRRSVPEGADAGNLVIAYEPVWAIGTGRTPSLPEIAEIHALIRMEVGRLVGRNEGAAVRILYGGSVKPSNAAEIMALDHVDGALVGGASLKAEDFLGIAAAYRSKT